MLKPVYVERSARVRETLLRLEPLPRTAKLRTVTSALVETMEAPESEVAAVERPNSVKVRL